MTPGGACEQRKAEGEHEPEDRMRPTVTNGGCQEANRAATTPLESVANTWSPRLSNCAAAFHAAPSDAANDGEEHAKADNSCFRKKFEIGVVHRMRPFRDQVEKLQGPRAGGRSGAHRL
jgi:hypothetical protein